jgi:hypothetical protein
LVKEERKYMSRKAFDPAPPNQLRPYEIIGNRNNQTQYIIHRSYGMSGSVEKSLAKLVAQAKKM